MNWPFGPLIIIPCDAGPWGRMPWIIPGWGDPCLWTFWLGDMCPAGDMWPAGDMEAGDMWLLGPGDMVWAGDMCGTGETGFLFIELGLNGFSGCWL